VVALVVAAEAARIGVGDVVAHRAVRNPFLDIANRFDEALCLLAWALEDVKREALRAPGTDAGETLQLFDEADEGCG
jgi:hypothetical protein